MEAISIGMLLGLSVGLIEEFVLKNVLQRLSYIKVLLIRTLLYSILVGMSLALVLSIEISFNENISYPEAFLVYLKSPLFLRDFYFSLVFIFLMYFLAGIVQIIGIKNLIRFIFGRYHQAREVNRVFMFIDLNESTPLAEKLGNQLYSNFMKEYFKDVSYAIHQYDGEVYQYVGDEISLVWPEASGKKNCVECFFKIQDIINANREKYLKNYGAIPEFKAGAHAGLALITEVGNLRKGLVYHGDVVNTTSRILGQCKSLGQSLIISEELIASVDQHKYQIIEQGFVPLKGKSSKIQLFGLQKNSQVN